MFMCLQVFVSFAVVLLWFRGCLVVVLLWSCDGGVVVL